MGGAGPTREPHPPHWSPSLIVLRIRIADQTDVEIRRADADFVLGSDPTVDVTLQGIGWAAQAARVSHEGSAVRIHPLDGSPATRLKLGERFQLGEAEIELAGLLPMAGTDATDSQPVFGDYNDPSSNDPSSNDPSSDAPGGNGATAGRALSQTTDGKSVFLLDGQDPALPRADDTAQQQVAEQLAAKQHAAKKKARAAAIAAALAAQGTRASSAKTSEASAPTSQGDTGQPKLQTGIQLSPEERVKLAAQLRGRHDFGEALVLQLKRSPFFILSGVIHALLFLLLMLLMPARAGTWDGDGPGTLVSELPSMGEQNLTDDELDEEMLPPEIDSADESVETPPEMQPDLPAPPAEETEADAPQLEGLPQPEIEPVEVGLTPRSSAFGRVRPRQQQVADPKALAKTFTKGGAEGVNREAARIVRNMALGRGASGPRGRLPRKSELLVVDGQYDHMENVLHALRVPFTRVDPISLIQPGRTDLDRFKVIFWNCGDPLAEGLMRRFRPRLREWIRKGGYLFTTDWAIAQILSPMFQTQIATSGGSKALNNEVVLHIQPSRENADHPLLKGVFLRRARGQWWLERASFDIIVRDRRAVKVLIEAPQLERAYRRDPAVAITFEHGRGRVLHVLGHYFQEAGNLAGTIASQRLALNFVMLSMSSR